MKKNVLLNKLISLDIDLEDFEKLIVKIENNEILPRNNIETIIYLALIHAYYHADTLKENFGEGYRYESYSPDLVAGHENVIDAINFATVHTKLELKYSDDYVREVLEEYDVIEELENKALDIANRYIENYIEFENEPGEYEVVFFNNYNPTDVRSINFGSGLSKKSAINLAKRLDREAWDDWYNNSNPHNYVYQIVDKEGDSVYETGMC